jgi:hypothetical protein
MSNNTKVVNAVEKHREEIGNDVDRFTHETITKRELVTPEIASGFVQQNFAKNRAVSKQKVKEYVSKINAKEFNFNTVVIAFCVLPSGEHILVNGQHCSFAIIESGISVELDIKYHNVNCMKDVESYYTTYDIGRVRSSRDRIAAIGIDDRIIIRRKPDVGVVSNALKMIIKGYRNVGGHHPLAQNPAIISKLSIEYHESINKALEIIDLAEYEIIKRFLRRPTVCGIMFETLDTDKEDVREKALEFWTRIATNDMGFKGDPVFCLLKSVIDGKFMKKQVYEAASYNVVAKCWNSFLSDRDMFSITRPSMKTIKLFK